MVRWQNLICHFFVRIEIRKIAKYGPSSRNQNSKFGGSLIFQVTYFYRKMIQIIDEPVEWTFISVEIEV